jgi:predicted hydrolase (HD superfamily)
MKNIKVGELEIPADYFSLPQDDKDVICNSILESILYLLEKHVDDEIISRKLVLKRIIESSIITNEMEENYEVAGVLFDIQKLIDA